MSLFLRAKNGPLKNSVFAIRKGLTLGRTEGEVIISDPNLSSRHAVIDLEGTEFVLIDLKSKNGFRVGGERMDRVNLRAGTHIQIGQFEYEIIAEQEVAPETVISIPKKKKARYWHEVLAQFGRNQMSEVENFRKALVPLRPAVVLDFIRGSQIDTRWILGYGPRRAGSSSLDLPIFEPNAPEWCFEVAPSTDGISFKTEHPEIVKLNGAAVRFETLRVGDIIKIYDSEIEVDFL